MDNMDRVEFAHSINTGDIDYETAFIRHFDQLMGVYGFFQPHNYQIEIVESKENMLVLNMEFSDIDSASKIAEVLDASDKTIQVYQRVFYIEVHNHSQNTLQLYISTIE